jgi:hypothetical protein
MMRRAGVMVCAALAVSGLVVSGVPAAADVQFSAAVFRATHNSYSGNLDGNKGSITAQLDQGVRFIEFDIHDNGYASLNDYAVGHDSPGNLVDHSGNPASNSLRDWMNVVATWSRAHTGHAPIVVMLDLKDDLTDNVSYQAGNLGALHQELSDVFGAQLALAKDYPTLPSVDSLRGRILPLLSGHAGSRAEYRRDVGYRPAVAINRNGQIVEVHDSGGGALWYWTGTYGPDGRVTWQRHGRFDTGKNPAVAINDNGLVVEVHESQSASTLWSRVGQFGANGDITWSASRQYDSGVNPTVVFTDPAGTTLREIHKSQSNDQNWTWQGTAGGTGVTWTGNARTADARYDKANAAAGSARVSVWTGADNGTSAQTLRYSTDRIAGGRITYPQTAFVEYQEGDSAELKTGALFYGAPASSTSFITSSRRAGSIVRGWGFNSAGNATDPLASYPATDRPQDSWYVSLMNQSGAVQ